MSRLRHSILCLCLITSPIVSFAADDDLSDLRKDAATDSEWRLVHNNKTHNIKT